MVEGAASRALAVSSSSLVIPIPWSSISIIAPPRPESLRQDTVTVVSGGENAVEFSISSASR